MNTINENELPISKLSTNRLGSSIKTQTQIQNEEITKSNRTKH